MKKTIIKTNDAPAAIGTYSQAVKVGDTVYLSGQIPLDPASGQMIAGDVRAQIGRVFSNLAARGPGPPGAAGAACRRSPG